MQPVTNSTAVMMAEPKAQRTRNAVSFAQPFNDQRQVRRPEHAVMGATAVQDFGATIGAAAKKQKKRPGQFLQITQPPPCLLGVISISICKMGKVMQTRPGQEKRVFVEAIA